MGDSRSRGVNAFDRVCGVKRFKLIKGKAVC